MRHPSSDKIITALCVFALCALIGVMTWHDMRGASGDKPVSAAPAAPVVNMGYYIPEEGATAEQAPDDSLPITIFQGSMDAQGNIHPAGIKPATFAQRQVNLALRLEMSPAIDVVPQAVQSIKTLAESWKFVGNSILQLMIDHRPDAPDFQAYAAFLQELKDALLKEQPLSIMLVVKPDWLTEKMQAQFTPVTKSASAFVITLEEASQMPLKDISWPFYILLPPQERASEALKQTKGFSGNFQTVDATTAASAKTKPSIGLLPLSGENE